MNRFQILPEERVLASLFGQEFLLETAEIAQLRALICTVFLTGASTVLSTLPMAGSEAFSQPKRSMETEGLQLLN